MTHDQLEIAMAQLQASVNTLSEAMGKLGAVDGLEWIQDLREWVLKAKLDDLRKNPR